MTRCIRLPRRCGAVLIGFVLASVAMVIVGTTGCGGDTATPPLPGQSVDAISPAVGEVAKAAEKDVAPVKHTAHYRAATDAPASMPPVLLTKGHQKLCRIGVGDSMPPLELAQLDGRQSKLANLYGSAATVVVFWRSDRRMSSTELADLGPDVVEPFGQKGVAVVGIAVAESARGAQAVLRQVQATFPNLLDSNGQAFALVGSEKLPRTYLLDPQGKVLWFDIEYSLATRRELSQALRAVVGQP